MKKQINILLTTLLLCGSAARAANIAWVSLHAADNTPSAAALAAGFTNAPDIGYTALLAANGHNVTRFVTVDSIQNFPDLINSLKTNDLIIISRSTPSGHYDTTAETAIWNAGLPVPLMSLDGYDNRGSRLGFVTGETIPDNNVFPMRLKVNAPGHPIFAGVSLDTNSLMVNPYSQRAVFTNATTGVRTNQVGISVGTSAIIAGGSILATVGSAGDAALNGMVIGEFPAGITSFRADVLAAKRLVFLTGSRESGITGDGAGIFDLQSDGAKLFLNAVTYLTTPQSPKVTVPLVGATNLVARDTWTFSSGPIGDAPLTYQWYFNGQPLAGATGPSLTFASLDPTNAGSYYMTVSNPSGSATSTVASLSFAVFPPASITNGLISYWPLDTVLGTKTPDLVSGYDMNLTKMSVTNIVAGRWGNAFTFDNATQTLLARNDAPGEALPIYQFPNFTVSAWVNGGIQTDHRVFSEGSLTNTNPMFDFETHNTGADGTVDVYIRSDTGATVGDHRHSTLIAYDSTWHNIVYVQRDLGNGNMTGKIYVDGVLDSMVITPIRPAAVNTTAIGGLRRASDSSWFTGLIDEVAAWNRALSPEEIGILQVTSITNPPSRLQPLAINRFKADLPAVVAGDSSVLRWDVSKDATLVTITPFGDVTAQTSVGVGSRTNTITQSATYVLTVKRGTETLSATTTVAVVSGVAPGWKLLDNFDQYSVGNLFTNGYWNDVSGNSAQVLLVNTNNHAVRTSSGGSIAYLNLRDATVLEGQARTLFFRMIPGADNAGGITNIVGLTDKSQRSYADEYWNIGPVLYATAFTNAAMGDTTNAWWLGARNGFYGNNTSPLPDFPGPSLESGVVYNVWIDITNVPLANLNDGLLDTYTVYLQKEGETNRIVVFQDYLSDRDPNYIDSVLGGMAPNLDKLVVIGNNATFSAIFDDFYLSTTGYNASVPRPYGFTGSNPPPGPLSIRSVGAQLQITWSGGTLQQANALTGAWADVPGNPASPYLVTPSGAATFYRSRQ